jgi:hypothetical protein
MSIPLFSNCPYFAVMDVGWLLQKFDAFDNGRRFYLFTEFSGASGLNGM